MLAYREKEVTALLAAFNKMQETKRLQVRFIASEIGWGKTALLNQFIDKAELDAPDAFFTSSYCSIRSEYSTPYQPFKELLKQLLGNVEEEEAPEKQELATKKKKKEAIKWCAKMVLEHAPGLVGSFIPGASIMASVGLTLLGKSDNGNENEKEEKVALEESNILEQYVDMIKNIAKQYCIVLIIEDLQWIDKSSAHLLYQLIKGLQKSPVMIIGLYRSTEITILANEGPHPLIELLTEMKTQGKETFLELDRLTETERRELMNTMLDSEANIYDNTFRETLFHRTTGNPLFITELVDLLRTNKMITKNTDGLWVNDAHVNWNVYPARIEGIIKERIAKLDASLVEALTYASVQGHTFIAQVLSRTMETSERDTLTTLSKVLQKRHQLVQEGNCVRSGKSIMSYFTFSNGIFQQYLYDDLSPTQKLLLHGDIGRALVDLCHLNLASVSGEIARHFELSGEYEEAIKYIRMSVDNMMLHSAYQDAALLSHKALSFLQAMPKTEDNTREVLYFTLQLCTCTSRVQGWGAPEVSKIFQQALALCEELACDEPRIRHGICRIHMTKLELNLCLEQAELNLKKAQENDDIFAQLPDIVVLGNTFLWLGRFKELTNLFAPYIALEKAHAPALQQRLEQLYLLMYSLLAASKIDDTELEAFCHKQILNKVEKSTDHFYRTMGYHALSWHACFSGQKDLGLYATKLFEHAEKYTFTVYSAIGKIYFGAHLSNSDIQSAIKHVEEGYAMLIEHYQCEPIISNSIYGYIINTCYLKAGMYDACGSTLGKVLRYAEERHDRCYLDTLYFLQAEYYKAIGNDEESKKSFEKALHIAESNGALRTIRLNKGKVGL